MVRPLGTLIVRLLGYHSPLSVCIVSLPASAAAMLPDTITTPDTTMLSAPDSSAATLPMMFVAPMLPDALRAHDLVLRGLALWADSGRDR